MRSFKLKISSPNGDLFFGEIKSIRLRGTEGELMVLCDHTPFFTAVKPCTCKIILDDDTEKAAHTEGGILTVSKEMTVFLSGHFEWET